MVQIMDERLEGERKLHVVLFICLVASIICSGLMIWLTGQEGQTGTIARAAATGLDIGSVTAGCILVGTMAANLVIWITVLAIGMLQWAGRSFGRSAPSQAKNASTGEQPNVNLGVS